jgi:CHASE3 domain sensor protein
VRFDRHRRADRLASAQLARHSEEVLATANQLERLVVDLETGGRGFVITGQERFLEPWQPPPTSGTTHCRW